MAWEQTLLECSFRGVKFDVVATRDHVGRAISVAEYPYQDGAALDDQGAKGRQVRVKAIFRGDAYEEQLAEWQALVDALHATAPGQGRGPP